MSSLKQRFSNLVRKSKFVCDDELIQQKKNDIQISDHSFTEVYNETRKLAAEIIEKVEDQRKKIKALYSAFNTSSDAIVVSDADGFIVFVNTSFLELYNYTIESLIGKSLNILRSPHTSDAFLKNMWDTIKSNQYWEGKLINKDSNGNEFWVLSKILPIMNGKPEPIYYVCTQTKL